MEGSIKLTKFNNNVLVKYQVYNSIFTTLPFDTIKQTGVLLPLFAEICDKGFKEGKDPTEIITTFYDKYLNNTTDKERIALLFQFIQYIERQVVLFDAVEESAFPYITNMKGIDSIANTIEKALSEDKKEAIKTHFASSKVRLVLTAHPTQFYPGEVLGIITDLSNAIDSDDMIMIKKLLAQLGKTPFLRNKKPTPYDEAAHLTWYLENIFYKAMADIYKNIVQTVYDGKSIDNPILEIGFWPGGDRDGNPFVTTEITLAVAQRLRLSLLKNYHKDIRGLKRRLTFKGVSDTIIDIEKALYKAILNPNIELDFSADSLIDLLTEIRNIIIDKHQSLFIDDVDDLLYKIKLFRLHFATLDIRQDSRIHEKNFVALVNEYPEILPADYSYLSDQEKLSALSTTDFSIPDNIKDKNLNKTIASMRAIKSIQAKNGEKGANRYVISNTQNAFHVMQVFAMLKMSAFPNKMPVDIVPLFETIDDLAVADIVMEQLYNNESYRNHLTYRGDKQIIMLGFSDGTKDGGYLRANWSIYQAKENLTTMAKKYDISVVFFDGRGGPPARGGGKTHQFYASLGDKIAHDEIQLTIQGQTISSHYGNLYAAQYNLEQLLSAGTANTVFYNKNKELSDKNRNLINNLAEIAYETYSKFKKHPRFLSYLEKMSTLQYYGKTNIGSRPSKRNKSDSLVFSDLRAIPFVGSWSQLKQNVPGFYGVGTALSKYEKQGNLEVIKKLYQESDFVKALFDNSMMSLSKSFFELTMYMKDDKEFGEFWQLIYNEYLLSKRLLLEVSGQQELMEKYMVSKASIEMREKIVLPLLTIQQFALQQIQKLKSSKNIKVEELAVFEKLVIRSLYGNINASRNSA